jgi:hypothetical protein
MLKFLKYTMLFFSGFALFIYCFKGHIYRNCIKYHEIKQRNLVSISDKTLIADLDFSLSTENFLTTEEIVNFAYYYTTDDLIFTFDRCSVNPNQILLGTQKSNCVGVFSGFSCRFVLFIRKKRLKIKNNLRTQSCSIVFFRYQYASVFKKCSPA